MEILILMAGCFMMGFAIGYGIGGTVTLRRLSGR